MMILKFLLRAALVALARKASSLLGLEVNMVMVPAEAVMARVTTTKRARGTTILRSQSRMCPTT